MSVLWTDPEDQDRAAAWWHQLALRVRRHRTAPAPAPAPAQPSNVRVIVPDELRGFRGFR